MYRKKLWHYRPVSKRPSQALCLFCNRLCVTTCMHWRGHGHALVTLFLLFTELNRDLHSIQYFSVVPRWHFFAELKYDFACAIIFHVIEKSSLLSLRGQIPSRSLLFASLKDATWLHSVSSRWGPLVHHPPLNKRNELTSACRHVCAYLLKHT